MPQTATLHDPPLFYVHICFICVAYVQFSSCLFHCFPAFRHSNALHVALCPCTYVRMCTFEHTCVHKNMSQPLLSLCVGAKEASVHTMYTEPTSRHRPREGSSRQGQLVVLLLHTYVCHGLVIYVYHSAHMLTGHWALSMLQVWSLKCSWSQSTKEEDEG